MPRSHPLLKEWSLQVTSKTKSGLLLKLERGNHEKADIWPTIALPKPS